jgi:adenine deaminase
MAWQLFLYHTFPAVLVPYLCA